MVPRRKKNKNKTKQTRTKTTTIKQTNRQAYSIEYSVDSTNHGQTPLDATYTQLKIL